MLSSTQVANDGFCSKYPCILVTGDILYDPLLKLQNNPLLIIGRGSPDLATRMFLKRLEAEFNLPMFALVDADPYGLEIVCTYALGSKVFGTFIILILCLNRDTSNNQFSYPISNISGYVL